MIAMKAMGVTSDQQVVQLVGSHSAYASAIQQSLHDAAGKRVYSSVQALEYIAKRCAVWTRACPHACGRQSGWGGRPRISASARPRACPLPSPPLPFPRVAMRRRLVL